MPRRPNTRPTTIYWLVDVRPETLHEHPDGLPFYCGKTVLDPLERRLAAHRRPSTVKRHRTLSAKFAECGEYVKIAMLESVSPRENWAERERFWIKHLRATHPVCLNVTDGGHGCAGMVLSPAHRAKLSAAHVGKKLSAEHCEKMRAHRLGKTIPVETRIKISAAMAGRGPTPEIIAMATAAKRGVPRSAETRAKLSAALLGRPGTKHTDESRAKIGAALRGRTGRKLSLETRAKMSAAHRRRLARAGQS